MQKVALVTAGGSGMGAGVARKLAAEGYAVGILSSSGKGEALATALGGIGVTGSNQSNDDVQRLVDAAICSRAAITWCHAVVVCCVTCRSIAMRW